jgi:hypothetical protein
VKFDASLAEADAGAQPGDEQIARYGHFSNRLTTRLSIN